MTPPLWLLDFDGVVNAVSSRPPPEQMTGWPRDGWLSTRVGKRGTVPILAAEPVLDGVRKAVAAGVDVQWLTTWEDSANLLLGPALGLPELPVAGRAREEDEKVGWDVARTYSWWWKLPVVQRIVAADPDRLVIWTDDDIRHHRPTNDWRTGAPSLMTVSPSANLGLTRTHLTAIERYLASAAATESTP